MRPEQKKKHSATRVWEKGENQGTLAFTTRPEPQSPTEGFTTPRNQPRPERGGEGRTFAGKKKKHWVEVGGQENGRDGPGAKIGSQGKRGGVAKKVHNPHSPIGGGQLQEKVWGEAPNPTKTKKFAQKKREEKKKKTIGGGGGGGGGRMEPTTSTSTNQGVPGAQSKNLKKKKSEGPDERGDQQKGEGGESTPKKKKKRHVIWGGHKKKKKNVCRHEKNPRWGGQTCEV